MFRRVSGEILAPRCSLVVGVSGGHCRGAKADLVFELKYDPKRSWRV